MGSAAMTVVPDDENRMSLNPVEADGGLEDSVSKPISATNALARLHISQAKLGTLSS
jgi:hypothetical protein